MAALVDGLCTPDVGTNISPVKLILDEVPADPSRANAFRHALSEWLAVTAFDTARIGDIALAVYEAMANAVEHAYRGAATTGTMTVRAAYSAIERALQIAVVDSGQWQAPSPDSLRGRGLALIAALTNGASVEHTDAGTVVLMTWFVDPPTPIRTGLTRRPCSVTEAYSDDGSNRAPTLEHLTTLLGYHRRSDILDLESVEEVLAPKMAASDYNPPPAAGATRCPATTATHSAAIIGLGAASRLLAELFDDHPEYLIEHTGHRGREHRPVRRGDQLHCDLFLDIADRTQFGDNLTVRCILTDDIGAMVSTTEERFVGRTDRRDPDPAARTLH